LTVIFENSYSNWTIESLSLAEATRLYDPNELAVVVHSVPEMNTIETDSTLRSLLAVGQTIWLTETTDYTELDAHFPVFVECLDALLS
jgi:hypothetical protein